MMVLGAAKLLISVVDRPEKILKARSIVHGPKAREPVAEELDLTLGEQPHSDDAFLRQRGAPTFLTCIS
jgi:hypothetical protein